MTRYFQGFVGESPLLEFRLQLDGLPTDVSTGFTMQLAAEDDADGTVLDAVDCSSGEEGAAWAKGVVTVRAAACAAPCRLLVALVQTRTGDGAVTTVDDGVLVIHHRPGLAET